MNKKVNHLNPKFQSYNEQLAKHLVAQFPLAEIITAKKDTILVSEIPLLWQKKELVGHLANNNPQLDHFKNQAQVKLIFSGPSAYLSPHLFDKGELPTFNFVRLHINGKVELKPPAEMLNDIKSLYQQLDTSTEDVFQTQHSKIEHLGQYITGFKIKISSIDFRYKLSQDKASKHTLKALDVMKDHSKHQIDRYIELLKQAMI